MDEVIETGAQAPESYSETPSVAAEVSDNSGEGNAPTPSTEVQTPQADVERQQSFAQRLKEQTEKRLAEERAKWDQEVQGKLSYLEKQAQISGFRSVDEYTKALDEHIQRQQLEQEAERIGVDAETYAQYFAPVTKEVAELRNKLQTYEQQMTEKQRQEQFTKQWGELFTEFPSLGEGLTEDKEPEWFSTEMKSLINQGYHPLHAYKLTHQEDILKAKEQEILARVTGRDKRQVLSSTDQPNNMQFDPANMTTEQILEISRRVQRGERITF